MVVICFEVVGVWINAGFWRSCWDLAVLVWFQFSLGLLVFAEFSIVAGSCCWIRALRCLGMVVICFEVVCVCGDLDCCGIGRSRFSVSCPVCSFLARFSRLGGCCLDVAVDESVELRARVGPDWVFWRSSAFLLVSRLWRGWLISLFSVVSGCAVSRFLAVAVVDCDGC